MGKNLSRYVCQTCAYESPRWVGKCPNCGTWNSLVEELKTKAAARSKSPGAAISAVPLGEVDIARDHRIVSHLAEFDRVLGGGIVTGSVILLGGDPGIGKSTLMMQLAAGLGSLCVLYVSGEESSRQIKLRAERLGVRSSDSFLVLAETNLNVVSEIIDRDPPGVIIVDSVQTMVRPELEAPAGSVSQVREAASFFTKIAKEKSIPVFLIGHVTKEGAIAGPKAIEHMVDAVLQFEGEQNHAYRILRAMKNRFGSTNEIGVFEMRERGLREVANPSEVFLSQRSAGVSGSMVSASIEGTRPILIEVQALVTPTSYGVPQRNTTGFDSRRLGLLIAVLEKRLGMSFGQQDVFVNIAGGLRIDEPAVDLAIALSMISSLRDRPAGSETVAVGEIGLGGEVRSVSQIEKRIQEATKLGFRQIVLPVQNLKGLKHPDSTSLTGVGNIEEAARALFS